MGEKGRKLVMSLQPITGRLLLATGSTKWWTRGRNHSLFSYIGGGGGG